MRNNFDIVFENILLQIINNKTTGKKYGCLLGDIKNEELKNEIKSRRPYENIHRNISDFIKVEQEYLIKQIKLEKGIAKNSLLKENLFLLFVSILTNIPLIMIGKPGNSKSLCMDILIKTMKGELSTN